MKLIFQNSSKEERVIAEVETVTKAFDEINKFCEELNYKIPYTRGWEVEGRMYLDVGSYTEFFILDPCTFENWLRMCDEEYDEENHD